MGTSCTIVLSLEQNPESMGQESAECLLFASAFQIAVSQEASGVRAGGTAGSLLDVCALGLPLLSQVTEASSSSWHACPEAGTLATPLLPVHPS